MKHCRCTTPTEHTNPRFAGSCAHCSFPVAPEVLTSDETHNAFLDRLEGALRAAEPESWSDGPPEDWTYFRHLCLQRERDGRERWGWGHLSRDNIQAGGEESSDAINYSYFDVLQAQHRGEDEEWALVLSAAYYDFLAYRARLELRAKRHHRP